MLGYPFIFVNDGAARG